MTGDPADLADLARLASSVAREAGALLRRRDVDAPMDVDTKSTPTDVVTEYDRAAERLIVGRLLGERPDDAVLGEEGARARGGSGVRWVVDPLDGTVNYLYGIPQYGVSIAAEVDGEVAAAVVLDVAKDALYAAVRGGGATRDGRPIRCSLAADLAVALVATGFGYDSARRAAQARVLGGLLPRVRDIRRFGAASLDLCAVAEGRVDAFYERGLKPWDLAAGGLVAQEAGARVAGLRGRPAGPELVVAAAPDLFEPLTALLTALDADRD